MQLVQSGNKSAAQKSNNSDFKNPTGSCATNAANGVQMGSRSEVPIMREQPDTEFFRLFDFTSKSATADNIGSSLRALQGAASAVFGGILSAVDTAFAILNEDMEYAADEVIPRNGHDSEREYDSESSCESIQIGAGENLAIVSKSFLHNSVNSEGKIDAPSLPNSEAMIGNAVLAFDLLLKVCLNPLILAASDS
ncbi:hypothetical protein HJC23_000311 [Cyclotella cryptica]|uniref:Uncharacterized protein n=1 Tax=Cyclotella cryptica TaxID=29204 RepID=A0ABD3P2X0_9STRA